MAVTKTIIWIPLLLVLTSSQHLGLDSSAIPGICTDMMVNNSVEKMRRLQKCTVVLGNLGIKLLETTGSETFQNISFPNLREVTGYVVLYRVRGLESVGKLFPNLARIRGSTLINNYGLIVYDMPNLREMGLQGQVTAKDPCVRVSKPPDGLWHSESLLVTFKVGLYSLLKIDRGGVTVWGGPHTCNLDTVDWNAIAPHARITLINHEMSTHCNNIKPCRCSANKNENFCWRAKKCQRFISGPRAEQCHAECLGCTSSSDTCSVCRHNTYRGQCVPRCPGHTIVVPDNQYCVTKEECKALKGLLLNNTCVFECPVNYRPNVMDDTCEPCTIFPNFGSDCKKVCPSLAIYSLSQLQKANKCVHINGSLAIHIGSIPGIVAELTEHLNLIETIDDYLMIFGSHTLKSLDFLSSLQHIAGRKLQSNAYSLIIYDMPNLTDLFPADVMKQLTIGHGKVQLYANPKLCLSKLSEFIKKFPEKSNLTDMPYLLNGYSGGCEDSLGLNVEIINETTVNVTFTPHKDPNIQYTVLYSKIPRGSLATEPETCQSEWLLAHTFQGEALLTSLHPASTYAVCIETYAFSYETRQTYLARTTIVNFTTPFKKPKPPFIRELVATSPNSVTILWVDHKDYSQHITHYQLDLTLVEISEKDLRARDHCDAHFMYDYEDYNTHGLLFKIPKDYNICGAHCNTLSEDLIEDHFEVCSLLDSDCDNHEEQRPKNSSVDGYVRTLSLDISSQSLYEVTDLAPYRNYKFRLRACAGEKCSISTRQVIRTLQADNADVPSITDLGLNKTGYLFVKWDPPDITNGPVLAYTVQILTELGRKRNGTIPDFVCVYPEHLSIVIRLMPAKEYSIRVCSTTLGSISACTDWYEVTLEEGYNLLLISFLFCILIAIISTGVGIFWNTGRYQNDTIPLVNMDNDINTIMYSESDPPNLVLVSLQPVRE